MVTSIDGSIDGWYAMSGTERRVSATEARVRFGELLDGVTARHDVVFVERAGKEVAVVVSVEDWEAACASRSDKWARANAMLAELHERLRAEGAIERLKDFDVEEAIRVGRDDRDEERYGRVR
jgi:prevent-host-death family protein